jgi:hypothetical protein
LLLTLRLGGRCALSIILLLLVELVTHLPIKRLR